MQFIKKTVILTGAANAGGTVGLEKNAFGVSATLSVYNLPDLDKGEYIIGFKWDTGIFKRKVGSLGRISTRFSLPAGVEFQKLHCVLYCFDKPLMYGVLEGERLWPANLMDGFKEDVNDTQEIPLPQVAVKANDDQSGFMAKTAIQKMSTEVKKTDGEFYSARKGIGEYFFDILPVDKRLSVAEYEDNRVAEVNYYPEQVSACIPPELAKFTVPNKGNDFVQREETPLYSKADLILTEKLAEERVQPSERMKKYLFRYRHDEAACTAEKSAEYKSLKQNTTAKQDIPQFIKGSTALNLQRNDSVKEEQSQEKTKKVSSLLSSQIKPPQANIKPPSSVEKLSFYEQVKEQVNSLFSTYERFDRLEMLIPSSRFVKVNYDDNGKYYVVGVIGKPDFLCYGVPSSFTPVPPKALDGYCTWVPTEPTQPKGEGFWLMYQDAQTGESVGNL